MTLSPEGLKPIEKRYFVSPIKVNIKEGIGKLSKGDIVIIENGTIMQRGTLLDLAINPNCGSVDNSDDEIATVCMGEIKE